MVSASAGVGFLAYGIYFGFICQAESYWMFFQAFFLPALVVVNFVRAAIARRAERLQVKQDWGTKSSRRRGAAAALGYFRW